MATSTVEDYLKSLFQLSQNVEAKVTVGGIAESLGVTPGTVSVMMRHLAEEKLVDYVPRRSISLTEKGRAEALQVVRRHRLIETFLVEVLKLDWSEVHEEAEILEHVVSDRLLDRIDSFLGQPTHDPHGDPIPSRDGKIADNPLTSLAEVEDGRYRIVRVSDEDSELLGWLDRKGLNLGEKIVLSRSDQAAGILSVAIRKDEEPVKLGLNVAERIFVEER